MEISQDHMIPNYIISLQDGSLLIERGTLIAKDLYVRQICLDFGDINAICPKKIWHDI